MAPVIHCTNESKSAFDSLDLGVTSQKEKMAALLREYNRLKAFHDNYKKYIDSDSKNESQENHLTGIPNSILFNKNGTWKDKPLNGYPGVVKEKVKRLYETIYEINSYLEPGEYIRLTSGFFQSILNTNRNSIKKAWTELQLEENEDFRKIAYFPPELLELEKSVFPDSNDLIFEAIINHPERF